MPKRTSLRDRNRASITAETPADVAQVTDAAPLQETAPAAPAVPAPQAPEPEQASAASTGTARVGIYLTREQFDGARAAYLTDWMNGGTIDRFADWIAQAISEHAARTPAQRAAIELRGRAETRTGSSRSFVLPADAVTQMRAAVTADNGAGRFPSDSAWCAEAIDLATANARNRNGGTLVPAPKRLPNRLVR